MYVMDGFKVSVIDALKVCVVDGLACWCDVVVGSGSGGDGGFTLVVVLFTSRVCTSRRPPRRPW